MTKEEFTDGYIEASDLSKDDYNRYFITLSCNCGERCCNGWACVKNDENSIKRHRELYN